MRLTGLLLVVLLAAAPAWAQTPPPADPIGAILDRPGQATPELEEPDTAAQTPTAPEPEPAFAPPPGAPSYNPQVAYPKLTAPVNINETGKSPDAPPTLNDLAYESRLRSSFASAQGFQGPLDGGWTLAARDGGELYALQLVERGSRPPEGAWRDLRRTGALGSSGFVDDIQRSGATLTLRFTPAPGGPASVATLQGGYDGRWTGELVENGERRAVSLTRKP